MPSVNENGHSSKPSSKIRAKLGASDIVSYEDLLIAQYIDDIKQRPNVNKVCGSSPYLGRYASLEEGLSRHSSLLTSSEIQSRRSVSGKKSQSRPMSGDVYLNPHPRQPHSAAVGYQKPKIDAKFIADPDLWDPATPRANQFERRSIRQRPESAPNPNRPASAKESYSEMIDRVTYLAKRPRKRKPVYKRQPYIIRCTAYKNGDRDIYANIAAPNVKELLIMCTAKLSLNGAARRLFLEDGSEIYETDEIPRDGEIYVSNGEAFKSPYQSIIKRNSQKQQLQWTMSGLVLPSENTSKKKKRFLLSKRFKNQVTVNNRRIMVFLNGQHTNGQEVVSDLKSMEDFLGACTARLSLRSHARCVYDWLGNDITNLDQISVLDSCLQAQDTSVLGPVWISCGGGFSPKGSCNFLEDLISHLRLKVIEANQQQSQLKDVQEGKKVGVNTAILSMGKHELDQALKIVRADIKNIKETLANLKLIRSKVKEEASKEENAGYSYTLQHIKQVDANDATVGGSGLRLKVYRNGEYDTPVIIYFNIRQASRGIPTSEKHLVMERLLDQCATRLPNASGQGTKFARKLYDAQGNEIKDAADVKYDQEVWLSMGEPFKVPYVLCVQANFEPVKGVVLESAEKPSQNASFRGQSAPFLETGKSEWEASIGFPVEYNWSHLNEETPLNEREEIASCKEVDVNSHYLVHKVNLKLSNNATPILLPILSYENDFQNKKNMVLYPEIIISDKKKRGSNEVWPMEAQLWVLNKCGYIYNRGMPQLVLALLDHKVEGSMKTKSATRVYGYAVGMQMKQEGNLSQQWQFSADGFISCAAHPELVLTDLGAKFSSDEDDKVVNEADGVPNGFDVYLSVSEKLSGKDAKLQRFGLKQERFDNLGQWKLNDHNVVTNPDYNKLAYSWPINAKEEWNDKFDWPMEFYLIAQAPPIKTTYKSSDRHTPLRLMVLKNGECDISKASPVVGPDLTNMAKDLSKQANTGSKKSNSQNSHIEDHADSVHDFPLHCDGISFRQLEFQLFLERCTNLVNLPFAARRLFDAEGREHCTLNELQRDQLVYVTCGELWSDPQLSKAEQQRRYLLANLASDIAQIRQFCALRDTEGYVLEVEGNVAVKSKLIINHCLEMQEKVETEQAQESEEHVMNIDEDLLENTTAHQRSHAKMDDKEDKLKWPWERLTNDDLEGFQESPRRSPSPNRARIGRGPRNVQKFVFDDGYIACQADVNLVIGVVGGDGQSLDVVLDKRKKDDPRQLWIIKPNGNIQCKQHKDMVLSVTMPTNQRRDEEGLALNYVGCQVALQRKRQSQFGAANQKWLLEKDTSFIYAFHTNHLDVEITSANKANVCTYAVTKEELDQPGYIVNLATKLGKQEEFVVCTSCARAMRGRHKLTKLSDNYDFSCAMGTAKEKNIKLIGSFQCLNGKVDLSTFEAINALDEWETHYNRLREESSVRSIAKELSAAKAPQSVKIYAYKNGEGRTKSGQLIIGSSIIGLLDQCTYRLGLTNAARRLYARDGTLILDINDIISWAADHYKKPGKEALEEFEKLAQEDEILASQAEPSETTKYQTFSMESEADGDSYQPVNTEAIELDHVLVEVERSSDVHVALVYNTGLESTVVYEIILSKESESAIILMPGDEDMDGDEDANVKRFPAIPPADVKEKYWIAWSNSKIQVGCNHRIGEEVIMAADDTAIRSVNYIVVASPGANTKWSFHMPVVDSCVNSNASGPTDLQKLMDKVELTEENDEDEVGSKKDGTSKIQNDHMETKRKKTEGNGKAETPSLEIVLRYPVEMWASAGEAFIKPEKVAADHKQMKHYRQAVAQINYELQKEKHKLRQMKGRRYEEMNPGHYEATGSSIKPVILRNNWQEPPFSETVTHDKLNNLQSQKEELKNSQKRSPVFSSGRLYTKPAMKRILACPNGESLGRAQYVWGANMDQLLQNATTRLNLRKRAKTFFSLNGQQVKFNDMQKDQVYCVSTGGALQYPKDANKDVEIRANWARARKQNGPDSTDIVISANINPDVDVNPFGPPSLASTNALQNNNS